MAKIAPRPLVQSLRTDTAYTEPPRDVPAPSYVYMRDVGIVPGPRRNSDTDLFSDIPPCYNPPDRYLNTHVVWSIELEKDSNEQYELRLTQLHRMPQCV